MAAAIDFDNKLRLRSSEIRNEATDGILPAKGRAQLARAKGEPKLMFKEPASVGPDA